jgi:hypothetical protein
MTESLSTNTDTITVTHNEEASSPQIEESTNQILSSVLRFAGCAILLAAAATFLFQRYSLLDSLSRYGVFLGFTALLGGLGFFSGVLLNATKSGRALLAVAAAIIPVHAAQLGALLYSCTHERLVLGVDYPQLLLWSAPSLGVALAVTLGAAVVLTGVVFTSFSVLVRAHTKVMMLSYLALNALLLVPTRQEWLVIMLLGLSTGLLYAVRRELLRAEDLVQTLEYRFVHTMLFVPVAVLIGRSLMLYSSDHHTLFVAVLFAALSALLFDYLPHMTKNVSARAALQHSSAFSIVASWGYFIAALVDTRIQGVLHYYIAYLPLSVILIMLSRRAAGSAVFAFRLYASAAASLIALVGLFGYRGFAASVGCLLIGTTVAVLGRVYSSKLILWAGIFSAAYGVYYTIHDFVLLYEFSRWLWLAIVGIVIMLAAAVLEGGSSVLIARLRGVFVKRVIVQGDKTTL